MGSRFAGVVQAALLAYVSVAQAATPSTQPAPPVWMNKPTTAWPAILLTNKQTDNSNRVGFSGSSGLARLPNGVVVLLTAGHLLNGVAPADFAKGFKSWLAVPAPSASASGPRMKSLAMDPTKPIDLDAIVLLPMSQTPPWPATVLPVRQDPLQVGETVYLIAIPAEKNERQHVRKAEVIRVRDDHTVEYNVEGKFVTTGNSGAPVIDSLGRYAGVNTGHLDQQDDPTKMKLIMADASALLAEVVMPPGMKPLVLTPPPSSPKTQGTGATNKSDPEDAAKQLLLAKVLIQQGMKDPAKSTLEAIIKDYPTTAAAKEAKSMLATLGH